MNNPVLCIFLETVSCGGKDLYPSCDFCQTEKSVSEQNGCNGNCELDQNTGECKARGNYKAGYTYIQEILHI